MRSKFLKEVAALGLPAGPPSDEVVGEADLAGLPEPVRRYLRCAGVLGRPRDWSFRLGFSGRFRLTPDEKWVRCEAWQYNSRVEVARIFFMRLRWRGFLPTLGRDTYRAGRGRMLIRPLDLVTVVDAAGREFDIGELVTYLNDAVLIAPSMLLGPGVSFSAVDDTSFDVALTDAGRAVSARVFLDEQDRPRDFTTTDRYAQIGGRLVQARWSTPVTEWTTVDGHPVPAAAKATWQLPGGPFTYADFRLAPETLAFNARPGE